MTVRRALLLAVALLAVGCAPSHKYDPLSAPDGSDTSSPTSSTTSVPAAEVVLPPVRGTTTTLALIGPGPVTITGRVDGPDGPVAGAIVRVERLVGGKAIGRTVPTAANGTWNVSRVLGGRYRVRAWLAPSLGMLRAQLVFVSSPRAQPIVLRVDRFAGTRIDGAMAPDPPPLGEQANVLVRVAERQVDPQGVVRSTPQTGLSVTLHGSSSWSVESGNPLVTGPDGTVTFVVRCLAVGSHSLSATLDDGTEQVLTVSPCYDPSAPTTTGSTTSTTTR